MHRFALKKVEGIRGRIDFYFLVIDGKCEADDFLNKLIHTGRNKDVGKLYSIIEGIASGMRLPPNRHKELQGRAKNDNVKDYEIKNGDLRLYYFEISTGKIVVIGANKNKITAQRKDIKRFREIKLEYLKSI